jgi:DNA-binding XRE family transcriptional regulator
VPFRIHANGSDLCGRDEDSQRRLYSEVVEPRPGAGNAGAMPAPRTLKLALAVKQRREQLALTQEQLDLDTDLNQRWISNVETGKRNPSYTNTRRLAVGLGLPASELLARAEAIEAERP